MEKKRIDSEWLREGILHASRLVVAEDFKRWYQISERRTADADVKTLSRFMSQLGSLTGDKHLMSSELDTLRSTQARDELLSTTPESWATRLRSIDRAPKALKLIDRALAIARPRLAAAPPELRDTHPAKPDFPAESSAAYHRARQHLISEPHSPRWLALLLFTLARAIISNTRTGFASDVWDEGTFFWFDLEKVWLGGDGARVGKLLMDANTRLFAGNVASNLGTQMPTRLAEAASIAPTWSLFHPPW